MPDALYFGTTWQTAGWLLEHESIRTPLLDALSDPEKLKVVQMGLFRQGPVRMVYDDKLGLVCFWNIDYLTGLADEGLGFIKLSGTYGLVNFPRIAFEAFERELTVLNYRLRNLIFESAYYHQDFEDGSHKVLAGRGTEARDYSIGYAETQLAVRAQAVSRKVVVCVGPEGDWKRAGAAATAERAILGDLSESLVERISEARGSASLLTQNALVELRMAISPPIQQPPLTEVTRRAGPLAVEESDKYRTAGWPFEQWLSDGTTLSEDQLNILMGDGVLKHPIRIIGPAGAGKTLLMQLMAMRLQTIDPSASKIIFITHNQPMELAIRERFAVLGAKQFTLANNIAVTTLERYANDTLLLRDVNLLEPTSADAKNTQLAFVNQAFLEAAKISESIVKGSDVLGVIAKDLNTFGEFVRSDFSVAIKAQNLQSDKTSYVNSSVALGKLHGILTPDERAVVYQAFQIYQNMLDEYGVLDTDDVALTMLGKLSSPVWHHQRKSMGFDYIFVDEAQLFNENERKIFQYLGNGKRPFVPIVLALDEGQQFFGESRVGLALLGIKDAERENLRYNHRMTARIADLAFYVISQSTELFTLDFPDYTKTTETPSHTSDGSKPHLERVGADEFLSNAVAQLVRDCRRDGLRQIAIVCFNESYWLELEEKLKDKLKDLDFFPMLRRGERPRGHSFTTLCRPAIVGGQEFDAVIAVGLEQGVVPKYVSNSALQTALEQQALRDVYVTFSRAKDRLTVLIGSQADPAPILRGAIEQGLLEVIP
ncbi:MAG TPA: UvrD-helicase domain-containing protein [Candidatus Baltobacteraceae bacterium]